MEIFYANFRASIKKKKETRGIFFNPKNRKNI